MKIVFTMKNGLIKVSKSISAKLLTSSAVSLLIVAPLALAEEAEHHAPGVETLGWPLVNFGIYAAIVTWVYRTKIAPVLRERSVEVEQFLKRAGLELAAVEREIADARSRLSQIERERKEIERELQVEGEQMAATILTRAQEDQIKIQKDAARQVEHEVGRVRGDLRRALVARAVKRAEEKLRGALSAQDERQLRDEVLGSFLG